MLSLIKGSAGVPVCPPRRQQGLITRHTLQTVHATSEAPAQEEGVRFKWDSANARWRRVAADKDEDGKFSLDKWEEGGVGIVQTKSGGAYTVWPIIHAKLQQRGLTSITAEKAEDMVNQGKATLVDVRPSWQFDQEHATGAVNVPLFVDVAGKTFWDTIKKLVVRFGMNMRATERDPDYRKNALQKLDKNQTVIVYCAIGGTLHVGVKPWAPGRKAFPGDPERQFGRESRSLKACYELQEAGFKNVLHLEGGLSQWRHDKYPVE